jgi:hypothetical protein
VLRIGLDSYDERNAVGQDFVDRFEARFGRLPDYFMLPRWRAVATVIVQAIANARPLTGEGSRRVWKAGSSCLQFG